jgi:hypothetical protein
VIEIDVTYFAAVDTYTLFTGYYKTEFKTVFNGTSSVSCREAAGIHYQDFTNTFKAVICIKQNTSMQEF